MEGMILDSSILSQLSAEQISLLEDRGAYQVYATYSEGSPAYTRNNHQPPFVSMHAGLWSDDGTTVHGSSHSMQARDAADVSPRSGLALHVIDGELYTYSWGDVRANPEDFKPLIDDLVQQVDSLYVARLGWNDSEG